MRKKNLLHRIASFMLVVFAFFTFFPVVSEIKKVGATVDASTYSIQTSLDNSISVILHPTKTGSLAVGKGEILVTTNSPAGYKLYISSDSNSNNLVNENSAIIQATDGSMATPKRLENNTWGFAIPNYANFDKEYTILSPSQDSKFSALPVKGEEILINKNSSVTSEEKTSVYFGVKVDTETETGKYVGNINYTTISDISSLVTGEATVTPNSFKIESYPSSQITIVTSLAATRDLGDITVTIDNEICTDATTINTNPLEITCTTPNITTTIGNKSIVINIPKVGKALMIQKGIMIMDEMQKMTRQYCEALPLEEQIQLYDSRDNKVYWVAKLKDGNCWMTQNLDYSVSSSSNIVSNLDGTTSIWDSTSEYAPKNSATSIFSSTDYKGLNSYNPGNYYIENGTGDETIAINCTTSDNDGENCHYHLGNYYQHFVALAGEVNPDTANGMAKASICPKGWMLPQNGKSEIAMQYSYLNLLKLYNLTEENEQFYSAGTMNSAPFYFSNPGALMSGAISNRGYYGVFFSQDMEQNPETFYLAGNYIYPSAAIVGYVGMNIRCVAEGNHFMLIYNSEDDTNEYFKEYVQSNTDTATTQVVATSDEENKIFKGWSTTINGNLDYKPGDEIILTSSETNLYAVWEESLSAITYMQEMTTEICKASSINESKQLIDSRDNKLYWVTKLEDGRCWMTQNLDYDIRADSNVASNQDGTTFVWDSSSEYAPTSTQTTTFKYNVGTGTLSYDPGDYYLPNGREEKQAISCTAENNDGENCHYHLGNYYQWNALTAGEGKEILQMSVLASICPKGWRIPAGGSSTSEYAFSKLFTTYNIGSASVLTDENEADMVSAPLYYVMNGRVRNGQIVDSETGYYWTNRTATRADMAVSLQLSVTNRDMRYDIGGYRYNGYGVRCVANGNQFTISYDFNGGENGPAEQVYMSEDDLYQTTVSSTSPTKEDYTFMGWSLEKDSDVIYQPKAKIYLSEGTLTLYAVWKKTLADIVAMQEMNQSICDATAINSTKQLVDLRDNKLYWVTKLKDEFCWMTQNLDYDIVGSTNPEDNIISSLYDDDRKTTFGASTAIATSTEIFTSTRDDGTYSYDPGNYYLPEGKGENTEITCTLENNGGDNCHYHLGNYYQWNAATGGKDLGAISYDTGYSICPQGWMLPTGRDYTSAVSFGLLTNTYAITKSNVGSSDSKLLASPLYFVRGGYVSAGELLEKGANGYYWSGSAYSQDKYAYFLRNNDTYVSPVKYTQNRRNHGMSVRCVAIPHVVNIYYDYNYDGKSLVQKTYMSYYDYVQVTSTIQPERDGYIFLGWSENQNAFEAEYLPGKNIKIYEPGLTLYAIWKIKPDATLSDVSSMQEMTSSICANSSINETKQLVDSRDNKLYWVAKLGDGNCWMTQNLDYDISPVSNTVSNADGTTSNWTSESTYSPRQTFEYDYVITGGIENTNSFDPGDFYIENDTEKYASCIAANNSGENCHNHPGNYYTWNAATAGTGALVTGDNKEAQSSICPAGWRLPQDIATRNGFMNSELSHLNDSALQIRCVLIQ